MTARSPEHLVERFLAAVAADPARVLVATGERSASGAELAAWAGGAAAALDAHPSGAVLLDPADAIDLVVGLLGCAATGRPAVLVDGARGPAARAEVAAATGAVAAVGPVGPVAAGADPGSGPDLPRVPSGLVGDLIPRPVRLEDPLMVLTTSGSTGGARRVVVRHAAVPWMAERGGPMRPLPADRHVRAFARSSGFAAAVLRALPAGVPLLAPDPTRRPPGVLRDDLVAWRPTVLLIVPTLFRRLLADRPVHLDRLRLVRFGGEPLLGADVAAARRLNDGVTVINGFSLTEMLWVTSHVIGPEHPLPADGLVPVGRPDAGRVVSVVGSDGRRAGPDEDGEIVVEGVPVTDVPGVLEVVGPDLVRHRTGDVGRLDADGVLHHLGRSDRMVKVGGVRVDPDVVAGLIRARSGVREAVVQVDPASRRLVADVVVDPGGPGEADLREHVRTQLAGPLLPARIRVRSGPVPLLPSGKPDLAALLRGG